MNHKHDNEENKKTLLVAVSKTETGDRKSIIITKYGKGEKTELYLNRKKLGSSVSKKPYTENERIGIINCYGFSKKDIIAKPDFRDKALNPFKFGSKVIITSSGRNKKGKNITKGIVVGETFLTKYMSWCLRIRTNEGMTYASEFKIKRGKVTLEAPAMVTPQPKAKPYQQKIEPVTTNPYEKVFPVMRLTRTYLNSIGVMTHKMSDETINTIASEVANSIKGFSFDTLVRLAAEKVVTFEEATTQMSSKNRKKD